MVPTVTQISKTSQNIVESLLPNLQKCDTYLGAAFEFEDCIRALLMKYGLFHNMVNMEKALCGAYSMARKLHRELMEDDVKLIVVENNNSIVPIMGLAMVSIFGLPDRKSVV